MKVPFVDLSFSYREIKDLFLKDVEALLDKGDFVYSDKIKDLEKTLSEYFNSGVAYCTSSGTSALELALRAVGIEKYDKVLVPGNTFIATAFAASNVGAIPVFMDVNPETWNIDYNIVNEALLKHGKIAAVMPVHLFGRSVDGIKDIYDFCRAKGIAVIEDCAQSFGGSAFINTDFPKNQNKKLGTFSDISAFSFYPTKNLGTIGNGGMVLAKHYYAEEVRRIRAYGEEKKYYSAVKGSNYNMSTIQALFLSCMYPRIDYLNSIRISVAAYYRALFKDCELEPEFLSTQKEGNNVYHLFPIKLKDKDTRDKLKDYLSSKEIGTAIHYPVPIHKQRAYAEFNNISLPVCEDLADTLLSLPMYPGIDIDQINYVVENIKEFLLK